MGTYYPEPKWTDCTFLSKTVTFPRSISIRSPATSVSLWFNDQQTALGAPSHSKQTNRAWYKRWRFRLLLFHGSGQTGYQGEYQDKEHVPWKSLPDSRIKVKRMLFQVGYTTRIPCGSNHTCLYDSSSVCSSFQNIRRYVAWLVNQISGRKSKTWKIWKETNEGELDQCKIHELEAPQTFTRLTFSTFGKHV